VTTSDDPVKLEGSDRMRVLLRAEAGRVSRIRTFSEDCPVDAGGLPLVWLEDVRPAESVALLVTFVGQPRDDARGKRFDDSAIAAIAFHADPSAVDTIIEAAKRDPDAHVRGQALFWLGQSEDPRALAFFEDVLKR
jgi:HEAT repeat protein